MLQSFSAMHTLSKLKVNFIFPRALLLLSLNACSLQQVVHDSM